MVLCMLTGRFSYKNCFRQCFKRQSIWNSTKSTMWLLSKRISKYGVHVFWQENEISDSNKQSKCVYKWSAKPYHYHKAPKFEVGDRVSITKYKNIFSKDYTEKWLKEVFMIDSMLKTNPWMHKITDLNRK